MITHTHECSNCGLLFYGDSHMSASEIVVNCPSKQLGTGPMHNTCRTLTDSELAAYLATDPYKE